MILFRSEALTVTPDRNQVVVSLAAIQGSDAPRGTAVRIEVRDSRTEEVLDSAASVLSIEVSNW